MGLGVLEDQRLEHVPGTVFLNEDGAVSLDLAAEIGGNRQVAAGLKHENNIVLVPQVRNLKTDSVYQTEIVLQPSSSTHDPLNWTRTCAISQASVPDNADAVQEERALHSCIRFWLWLCWG
jgi:hypothetical protein